MKNACVEPTLTDKLPGRSQKTGVAFKAGKNRGTRDAFNKLLKISMLGRIRILPGRDKLNSRPACALKRFCQPPARLRQSIRRCVSFRKANSIRLKNLFQEKRTAG